MANTDKLNKISIGKSKWIENAKKRQKNKTWLKHSQKIALKILQTIRDKKITQKELAERINVSPQQINKIVKGKENMTLETIAKLENALGISLLFSDNKILIKTKTITKKEFIYLKPETNKTSPIYEHGKPYYFNMHYNLNLLSEKTVVYGQH